LRSATFWSALGSTFWSALWRIATFGTTFGATPSVSTATASAVTVVIVTTRAPTTPLSNQRNSLALMDISPATAEHVQKLSLLLRDQRHNLRRGSIKRARSNNFLRRRIAIRSVVLQQLDGQGPKIGISHV
jgi:hypothetical protein